MTPSTNEHLAGICIDYVVVTHYQSLPAQSLRFINLGANPDGSFAAANSRNGYSKKYSARP